MYAAHRGHMESVKALLADRRTNVNATSIELVLDAYLS